MLMSAHCAHIQAAAQEGRQVARPCKRKESDSFALHAVPNDSVQTSLCITCPASKARFTAVTHVGADVNKLIRRNHT